ncbi:MAG: hypothetical protein CBC09_07110 [Cellvibrionales bacterium TMED49]|nr:hypothetical protein [Porticoccaceae bacterium]OUU37196.1 MAG: hypothetical protein CBC09_07110 [Cellvibrionales bacterium TMED49]
MKNVYQLRKKKHDLALLHEECELNFRRLHRLLPNTKKIGEEISFSPFDGYPGRFELRVIDVTRYTSLVRAVSLQSTPHWVADIDIQVRVYRDAQMAEVVEWCRDRSIPWALSEPSGLQAPDEKWQWNLFLSELLVQGIRSATKSTKAPI